jgi:hypothetical protein
MNNIRYDEADCHYCGKTKEGARVTMDGTEVFLCKSDFWRMLRLKGTAKAPKTASTLERIENGR